MARDIRRTGVLQRRSSMLMWTAYAAHAAATLSTLRRRGRPPGAARTGGVILAIGGSVLLVGGAAGFGGLRELEGTRAQPLTTAGVYRWSRNPQYTGYVLLLSGAAVHRGSAGAGLLTGVAALLYAAWVPVEEEQLERRDGAAFRAYVARTHRWLGPPR